jgi:NAD(P)-dependent dehydrogenase (short-subunit alcohol dehydrogenase family)
MRLQDKTALVTGATSNIGRAIAFAFAAEGAHVVVSGRSRQRGEAPFFLTAAIAPAMAARGAGAIVNLGSWIARLGIPVGALYSSTKGAVETLTRAWAAEFGPSGVRVNAISPGVIRPDSPPDDPAALMMRGTPAGRPGTPEAIAHAAVYLASDEAAFVHGTVIDVDGGRIGAAVVAA